MRPEVSATSPDTHGSIDYAELESLGIGPNEVLDFSVNGNPYGPSAGVLEAVARVPIDRYPDRECLQLRRVLSQRLGVAPDRIVAGNGTAELLWLLALAYIRPGDTVLVVTPTFGEYARAARLAGARVEQCAGSAATGFLPQPDRVGRCLRESEPRAAFICNPNNPTGTHLPPEVISGWARENPQTLFVIDEAYIRFAPGAVSALSGRADNVVVLRSMTKDYALAGLRLGYAVGHRTVIEALAAVRPPWNVNAAAQAAGVAALADEAGLQEGLASLSRSKQALVSALREMGFHPLTSAVHFFIVPIGDAAGLRRDLLARRVLVRDCTSFGLPEYVRIAARRPDENVVLVEALREMRSLRQPV